jgi:hypothetical protein
MTGMYDPHDMSNVQRACRSGCTTAIGGDLMATEQLGICENCRQPAMCVMEEIAPCVRMQLCRACGAASARCPDQQGLPAPPF